MFRSFALIIICRCSYHELGHIYQKQFGALERHSDDPKQEFVWQLFTEGIAMYFEQALVGNFDFYHQDVNGWKNWCDENLRQIASDFCADLPTMTRLNQRYFGDWVDYHGYGDVGYYLGTRFVHYLLESHELSKLINMESAEVFEAFTKFVRTQTNERLESLCSRNSVSLKILTTDDPDAPGVQTGEKNGVHTVTLNTVKISAEEYDAYAGYHVGKILLPKLLLETERLVLRRYREEDAESCFALLSNEKDAYMDCCRAFTAMDEEFYSGETLGDLGLTYYSHIDPNATVEIANYLKAQTAAGKIVFYDIYTEEEKAADPAKADTGLFYFKGTPGEKFAICNAGGAFAFVGAMHDSFPHALNLSKQGYNAFALIYRPGAQTACEDLARAITFIFDHAEELEVDTACYSLWGGSAGARMAAWLGTYGPAAFGGDDLPRPGTVVMQYTGLSEYSELDPPTYVCVGDRDGIANWRTMKARLDAMSSAGIDTEFHVYTGLGHGFGLGSGTVAEGWINDAIAFWEKQMEE